MIHNAIPLGLYIIKIIEIQPENDKNSIVYYTITKRYFCCFSSSFRFQIILALNPLIHNSTCSKIVIQIVCLYYIFRIGYFLKQKLYSILPLRVFLCSHSSPLKIGTLGRIRVNSGNILSRVLKITCLTYEKFIWINVTYIDQRRAYFKIQKTRWIRNGLIRRWLLSLRNEQYKCCPLNTKEVIIIHSNNIGIK